jgi:FtsP/CotA-like multicopper oxidase with cupredoxin domain
VGTTSNSSLSLRLRSRPVCVLASKGTFRCQIDVSASIYDKKLIYMADPVPPEPNERGWKDTVRATPGASTRIIVKFEGYTGRYVWHCHILEHEDNEMMRPYEVVSATGTNRS